MAQNYTNYEVIYVSNAVPVDTEQKVIQLIKKNKSLKVSAYRIHSHQALAYMYWLCAHLFCDRDRTILMDSNSELVGRNLFNVIDWKLAEDPDLQIVYTGFKNKEITPGNTFRFDYEYQIRNFQGRVSVSTNFGSLFSVKT